MKAAVGNFIPQRLKRLALLMAVAVLPMIPSLGAHALIVDKINDQTAAELLVGLPGTGVVESALAPMLVNFVTQLEKRRKDKTGEIEIDWAEVGLVEISAKIAQPAREELYRETLNHLKNSGKTEIVRRVFKSLGEKATIFSLRCANVTANPKNNRTIDWAKCESWSGKKITENQRGDIKTLNDLVHQAASTPAFQLNFSKAMCTGIQELSKRYTADMFGGRQLKTETFKINMGNSAYDCDGVVSGKVETASALTAPGNISDEIVVDGLLGDVGRGFVEARMLPVISGVYLQLEQRRTNGGASPWSEADLKQILTNTAQIARPPLRTAMLARMKQGKLISVAERLDRSLGRESFIIALRCAATARKREPSQGADWSVCEKGQGKTIGSEERVGLESLVQAFVQAMNEPRSHLAMADATCRGAEMLISRYTPDMLGGYMVPPDDRTVTVGGTERSCNDILSGKVTVQ